MGIPLSNTQKATLSQTAKRAWQRHREHGLTEETEKDWRTREAIECCKCRISEATNGNFLALDAHFKNLAGDSGGAFKATMKMPGDEKRQAMAKLKAELKKAGKDISYAEAISKDTFKRTLEEASPAQVWKLMFTVRNRA